MTTRKGFSLVYSLILLMALFAFASLAVDLGRVQVAKSQMRAAADAASRNGAVNLINGVDSAIAAAIDAADDNTVDGKPLKLDRNLDIEIGYWNSGTRSFTKLTGSAQANANAVRVIGRRIAARKEGVPTLFAQLIGRGSCDVTAESISMAIAPKVTDYNVPATANPFLAGMPTGTVASPNNPHNNPDHAPYQSPVQVTAFNLTAGAALSFDNIADGANNDYHWSERYQPDGNLDWIVDNYSGYTSNSALGPELGKSDMVAPINALVGVFLSDAVPTNATAPAALDFSSAASRNFESLSPKIGQVFFIGDGKRDSGAAQKFIVPPGATRFYLASWDGYEWNNNVGTRTTRVSSVGNVVTVK
jgi:hypothetical protein